ncbi:asparagine synthetase A [Xenorhabdus sp. Sc-CR9]|uniref:asparagine synthetase A n=1 Tax=Xenorhabdus sp. Sc-CR9 TaxID=2584468 RepID=UPI001F3CBEC2|nr:asparagine synthetase A [Xenorhabdus sp. Sc-CR9]
MLIDFSTENRWSKVLESTWYRHVFHIYSDIMEGTFLFYNEKGFSAASLPITCSSVSSPMGLGSDSIPVKINLMGQEIYLADSMQFLLEYALRLDNKGVWYTMPSFRGEDSDERHLNQFYHSESEIVGGLDDVIFLSEEYIKYITEYILKKGRLQEIKISSDHLKHIRKIISWTSFPRIKYQDAVPLLKSECPDGIESRNGISIVNSIGEKYLIQKHDGAVWLTHMEHQSVPFYQQYDPENNQYALAADLLIGMGETIGCGERADYNSVRRSLDEHHVNPELYRWYINMKKHYPLRTSGFGMGIERYIAWLTKHHDIRDIPVILRDKSFIVEP